MFRKIVRTITGSFIVVLFSLALASPAGAARTLVKRPAPKPRHATHLVDINRASASELKTLPGIADALAGSIARHRPYENKAQLLSRKVIPESIYRRIKTSIIARQ